MITIAQPANAMAQGALYADQIRQAATGNKLAQLYETQGPGLLAGDPGAMNALAGLDPMAAMGMQQNQLGMQAQRQDMAFSAEKMQMLREQTKTAAAEKAAALTAEQRAAEADKINTILSGAAAMYSSGNQAGYTAFLQQQGLDPAQFPFEQFPAYAAMADGALEALQTFTEMGAGPKPADEYQRYVQEETAAGRAPLTRLEFGAADRAPATGLSIHTNPDGSTTILQGPGVTAGGPDVMAVDPRAVDTVVQSADAILADPALNKIVGPIEGGGGNNVDDLNAAQRMWYGPDGLALIQRVNQLQSTAWLAARQMLKGGGAITDYESKKAEAAMLRLSRAQGEAEFKAALIEFRDAVKEGQAKLLAAQGGEPAPATAAETQESAANDFSAMTPDELQQQDVSKMTAEQATAYIAAVTKAMQQ